MLFLLLSLFCLSRSHLLLFLLILRKRRIERSVTEVKKDKTIEKSTQLTPCCQPISSSLPVVCTWLQPILQSTTHTGAATPFNLLPASGSDHVPLPPIDHRQNLFPAPQPYGSDAKTLLPFAFYPWLTNHSLPQVQT